ncbi:hypothetical protein EJB05_14443, partial [Eragrostis curvula]
MAASSSSAATTRAATSSDRARTKLSHGMAPGASFACARAASRCIQRPSSPPISSSPYASRRRLLRPRSPAASTDLGSSRASSRPRPLSQRRCLSKHPGDSFSFPPDPSLLRISARINSSFPSRAVQGASVALAHHEYIRRQRKALIQRWHEDSGARTRHCTTLWLPTVWINRTLGSSSCHISYQDNYEKRCTICVKV